MKRTALITGASSGIGEELAKRFARDGHDLVLVARNTQRLDGLAHELKKQHNISIEVIPCDLSKSSAAGKILKIIQQKSMQVDILVNNAGFNVYGAFSETSLEEELAMIQVHVTTLTQLTKLFLPGMVQRGFGKIMNVATTGSFTPLPLDAVYGASKAYVLSFSEAIAQELQGTGVTVTALCPGVTRTEFAQRANMQDTRLFRSRLGSLSAANVAGIGYRALMNGRRVIVSGLYNKLQVASMRFLPRGLLAKMSMLVMSRT